MVPGHQGRTRIEQFHNVEAVKWYPELKLPLEVCCTP